MIKFKILTLLFAIKNLFIPCHIEKKESGFKAKSGGYKIERVATLPDSVLESSGLEIAKEGQTFWTHGDSGNKNQLIEIDKKGTVISILPLPKASNKDWEELAKDDVGNIYVCDVGNNYNVRKDLRIFKVNVHDNNSIDTISFKFADQHFFPPGKEQMNFDCEAVFWYNKTLYLFSKNKGNKYVKIYTLPDKSGNYVASIADSIYLNSPVTAADINPDGSKVVLLTYSKMYLLNAQGVDTLKLKAGFVKRFNRSIQSEAIVFINNTDLLISNEQRQLFLMRKKQGR
jgi:hypothetical protein